MAYKYLVCAVLIISQFNLKLQAQKSCLYTNLSYKYDYSITVKKENDEDGIARISLVKVDVLKKRNKIGIQSITIYPDKFTIGYNDCGSVESYITGYNKNKFAVDEGDFCVADFNFDGIEDFAINTSSSASLGIYYQFFIGTSSGKFIKDIFLTDKIGLMPIINTKTKTLEQFPRTNAGHIVYYYKYNSSSQKWTTQKKLLDKIK